ncbi:hypothetical protein MKW98_012434 [Papaver atlanticum]|uniref:Cytochrome P450 n=1 Tax=Papaver atlanticum TaxID=357466 RepID=A0AAD4S0F2_9MAGN|nr:hypothetical protein MKW98_012434 [Papaver atlanticum]
MHEIVKLAGGFDICDMFPSVKFLRLVSSTKHKLEKSDQEISNIINNIIMDHRENRTSETKMAHELEEDLVDALIRVQENNEFEPAIGTENIKSIIMDIFAAGTDTSSTVLEWAMSELMKNPRVMEKVQAEVRQVFNGKKQIDEVELHKLEYLNLVVKETLRLHPAGPLLLPRECREKCEINGYEIPKKAKVIVNAWEIARNSDYWSDADKFQPERFSSGSVDYRGTNFEYIPFGAGRRMCPGISFGIANIELPLAQLLYHFDWKLPDGIRPENLDMSETFGSTVRRRNDLYLIPIPCSSVHVL